MNLTVTACSCQGTAPTRHITCKNKKSTHPTRRILSRRSVGLTEFHIIQKAPIPRILEGDFNDMVKLIQLIFVPTWELASSQYAIPHSFSRYVTLLSSRLFAPSSNLLHNYAARLYLSVIYLLALKHSRYISLIRSKRLFFRKKQIRRVLLRCADSGHSFQDLTNFPV